MHTLTSRERVSRMLEGLDHDRVPRHDGFWRETIVRWEEEGLRGGEKRVLELLGSDLERIGRSDPVPYPGQEKIVREDAETCEVVDRFGARQRSWRDRSGPPTHLDWECKHPDDWRKQIRPKMEGFKSFIHVASAQAAWRRASESNLWTCFWCTETCEFALRLMGFERMLTAIAAEPDWIREISQFRTDLLLRDFDTAVAAGVHPDGLWRTKLSAGKTTRRYMYHSDHSVPPNVSWQTYLRLIGLLDRYGEYE